MSTKQTGVIIGLTGGIATGKSTVTRIFQDLGVVVIDADLLAREIVAPGQPALKEILNAFGQGLLTPEGTLNRTALGDRIFRDEEARRTLEFITHPRIAQAMVERATRAFERGHLWVVYDAALLVETGTYRFLDSLIVVDSSPATQLRRLQAREDISSEEAQRRVQAQMPLIEKRAVADYIIDNEGTLEETRQQVEALKQRIDHLVATLGTAKPQAAHGS